MVVIHFMWEVSHPCCHYLKNRWGCWLYFIPQALPMFLALYTFHLPKLAFVFCSSLPCSGMKNMWPKINFTSNPCPSVCVCVWNVSNLHQQRVCRPSVNDTPAHFGLLFSIAVVSVDGVKAAAFKIKAKKTQFKIQSDNQKPVLLQQTHHLDH